MSEWDTRCEPRDDAAVILDSGVDLDMDQATYEALTPEEQEAYETATIELYELYAPIWGFYGAVCGDI